MPKLKDKVYGEMNWEQWEEDIGYWFSLIKDDEYESFELFIHSDSPMNFLAVRNTHQTFDSLMINLPGIEYQAVQKLFKNTRHFPKKKDRDRVKKKFEQMLELFSIEIFEDLYSIITFRTKVIREHYSVFIVDVGPKCEVLNVRFKKE